MFTFSLWLIFQPELFWEWEGILLVIIPGWQHCPRQIRTYSQPNQAFTPHSVNFCSGILNTRFTCFTCLWLCHVSGIVPGEQKVHNKGIMNAGMHNFPKSHLKSAVELCDKTASPSLPGLPPRPGWHPSHIVLTSFSCSSSELNLACSSTWVCKRFFSSSAARDAASSSFYPMRSPSPEKWDCYSEAY